MSLSKDQRDLLRSKVQAARERLTRELTEVLEGTYGVHRDGRFEALEHLPLLQEDERARETRELLERLLPEAPTTKAAKKAFADSFDATMRSIAFTHLNRLVAFKMMEHPGRKLIKETVGRYTKSRGFLFFLADRPEVEQLYNTGREDEAYREFLLYRCGELDQEIGLLFDPDDLANRVFPRPRVLQEVLAFINDEDLKDIWSHDEALGWTYQYYTPKEVRDQARKESKVPRNSYELAFLNQFYTPDYVVRFLADNTLGRLWLEMNPASQLREQCEYLVLAPDEDLPAREKKDPREIRVLDPACGSGHFLLYAFDLLHVIYLEAWRDPHLRRRLAADFVSEEAYRAAIPILIVENNLYGIDIDRRATQIANLALFLKAKTAGAEGTIQGSGIVCAAPMPGGNTQLQAFKNAETEPGSTVLRRVLDALWNQMELAGEAGSLLKMEASLSELVEEERQRWLSQKRKGGEQQNLLEPPPIEGSDWVEYKDLDGASVFDGDVWTQLESRIRTLFYDYAASMTGVEGTHRRLFAQDGAEALRFIELLRSEYDVLLMNPPFGFSTPALKPYLADQYPKSKNDLAAVFLERASALVAPNGLIGAITTRSIYFLGGTEKWRGQELLRRHCAHAFADLGGRVLDGAMVDTAAAVFSFRAPAPQHEPLFFRLHAADDKAGALLQAVRDVLTECATTPPVYRVPQNEFLSIPHSPFAYWLSAKLRGLYTGLPGLEPAWGRSRCGMGTLDNFRFVRCHWEVPIRSTEWATFATGGSYMPFYQPYDLVVRWEDDGHENKVFVAQKVGSASRKIQSESEYFKPGVTFLRRTRRLACRVLPAGAIFSDASQAVLPGDDVLPAALLGFLNSAPYFYLLKSFLPREDSDPQYQVGQLRRTPSPKHTIELQEQLANDSLRAVVALREVYSRVESTTDYEWPLAGVEFSEGLDSIERQLDESHRRVAEVLAQVQYSIDAQVCTSYGVDKEDRNELLSTTPVDYHKLVRAPDRKAISVRILSWALGVVLGRWDVRLALDPRSRSLQSDPFSNADRNAPASLPTGTPPAEYPVDIDSDGILVCDPAHQDDVVARLRSVLRLVWGDVEGVLETEICRSLGVRTLADYFGKAGKGGFWSDHFSMYKAGKREAPVYWLLQSSDGSYSVWLYYQRLNKDALYKVLQERYLLGRIERCRQVIQALRPAGQHRDGLTRAQEKQLAVEEAKLVELEQFEKDIRDVVELQNERGEIVGYEPDLNDGVVLNAAPLHKLIPWPVKKKKQGELELYWEQLAAGEYDWAHIAMRFWPDRVLERCKDDRSMAIAHGLHPEPNAEAVGAA